jgi:enamine deaminase RidA (YjgF/YER057c/UK114 family)
MGVQYVTQIPGLGKLYGAYSPASKGDGSQLVSIAGQLGGRPDGSLPGDGSVYAQTKQSFANIGTVWPLSHHETGPSLDGQLRIA